MRKVLLLMFFFLFLLFQSTTMRLFPLIEQYFFLPNLPLILLAYVALFAGPEKGIVVGFFTGFFEDSLSVGLMGVNALVKTLLGFFLGLSAQKFFIANRLLQFVALIAVTIINDAGREIITLLLGAESSSGILTILTFLLLRSIPQGILNGVVGVLFFIVFEYLSLVPREPGD